MNLRDEMPAAGRNAQRRVCAMKKPVSLLLSALFLLLCLLPSAVAEDAAPVAPGDTVFFGTYPQNKEGTDDEPVEWMVLDVQDGKCFLLSKKGLIAKSLHTEDALVTWETCALRAWLNDEFLNDAFTEEEQAAIFVTDVDNGPDQCYSGWKTSGGNNTQDKVFLLSYGEAHKYLKLAYKKASSKPRFTPTEYAIASGAWITREIRTSDGKLTGWWLLRSPGPNEKLGSCVNNGGSLSDCAFTLASGCIRPAMWVDAAALSGN